ncbi:hypothetical protein [Aliamphritea spongicola]
MLDPPRAGAENIIEQVCKLKAEKILYIACNPGHWPATVASCNATAIS